MEQSSPVLGTVTNRSAWRKYQLKKIHCSEKFSHSFLTLISPITRDFWPYKWIHSPLNILLAPDTLTFNIFFSLWGAPGTSKSRWDEPLFAVVGVAAQENHSLQKELPPCLFSCASIPDLLPQTRVFPEKWIMRGLADLFASVVPGTLFMQKCPNKRGFVWNLWRWGSTRGWMTPGFDRRGRNGWELSSWRSWNMRCWAPFLKNIYFH